MSNGFWYLVSAQLFGKDGRKFEKCPALFDNIDDARIYVRDLIATFYNADGFSYVPIRMIDGLPKLRGKPKEWEQLPQWADSNEVIGRMQRLNEVTADHLRKARRELATLRFDLEEAEEILQLWHGSSSRYDVSRTPEHYRGDGLVTCSRAMESAASQEGARELPVMAMYWWGCAFKYIWRMWSKGDPESDAEKACDCIRKAVRTWSAARNG